MSVGWSLSSISNSHKESDEAEEVKYDNNSSNMSNRSNRNYIQELPNDSSSIRIQSSELELSKMLEERFMAEMNKKLVQGMPKIIREQRDPRQIFEQLKAVEGLGLVKALEIAAAEYLGKL